MSAKNWNWVNDKALMNEIVNLDNKLSNYELTLYWCTSEVSETTFALTIVSKIDSSIVIRDTGFIHTHLLLWSDKLKTRLQLISERVEFIAFVHDSILKLKKSDERLSFGELRFVRHYDSDYGDVDFDFKNGLKLVGVDISTTTKMRMVLVFQLVIMLLSLNVHRYWTSQIYHMIYH